MDVIGSSPVGPTLVSGGSVLPERSESSASFEDSQGNPDWAGAGKSVAHSKVNRNQLDETSTEPSVEEKLTKNLDPKPASSHWQRLGGVIGGLLALSWVVAAPLLLIEFAPSGARQSGWLLGGMLIGGLLAALIQFRSTAGPLASSASVFGVWGSRATVYALLAAVGIATGASFPKGSDSSQLLPWISIGAVALLIATLGGSSWWLRTFSVSLALGVVIYILVAQGASLNFEVSSIPYSPEPDVQLVLLGFALAAISQLLVRLTFPVRLFVAIAVPVLLAVVDLAIGTAFEQTLLLLGCVAGGFTMLAMSQFTEIAPQRGKAVILRMVAFFVLAGSFTASWLFATQARELAIAVVLFVLVWVLIQIPGSLARRIALHKKSLGLSYGFYGTYAWWGLVGLLLAAVSLFAAALFAASLFAIDVIWLSLACVALGLLFGLLALPRFLRAQAEHRAAEKRKNEPVRASSEDLQWSD